MAVAVREVREGAAGFIGGLFEMKVMGAWVWKGGCAGSGSWVVEGGEGGEERMGG